VESRLTAPQLLTDCDLLLSISFLLFGTNAVAAGLGIISGNESPLMLIQFHHRRDINKKYLSYRVLLLFL
jgi:hypothetical protein